MKEAARIVLAVIAFALSWIVIALIIALAAVSWVYEHLRAAVVSVFERGCR